ncbi:hypothetical protein D3C71_786950 [compost metagenome]
MFFFQDFNNFVGYFNRIQIFHPFVIIGIYQTFDINPQSKHTHLDTAFMKYRIILGFSFKYSTFKVIVGRQKWKFGMI